MKCYKTLFSHEGLIKNIGSYLLIFTIFLFMISSILFYKCGYPLLEDDINEIIKLKEENDVKNINIKLKDNIKGKRKKKKKKKKKEKKSKNDKPKIPKNLNNKTIKKKNNFSKTKINTTTNNKSYSINELKNNESFKYLNNKWFRKK